MRLKLSVISSLRLRSELATVVVRSMSTAAPTASAAGNPSLSPDLSPTTPPSPTTLAAAPSFVAAE